MFSCSLAGRNIKMWLVNFKAKDQCMIFFFLPSWRFVESLLAESLDSENWEKRTRVPQSALHNEAKQSRFHFPLRENIVLLLFNAGHAALREKQDTSLLNPLSAKIHSPPYFYSDGRKTVDKGRMSHWPAEKSCCCCCCCNLGLIYRIQSLILF